MPKYMPPATRQRTRDIPGTGEVADNDLGTHRPQRMGTFVFASNQARTGSSRWRSISTTSRPTPPTRPAAPVTRIGASIDMDATPTWEIAASGLPSCLTRLPARATEEACATDGRMIPQTREE